MGIKVNQFYSDVEKQYWREKSKQNAAYKKRSREKVLGLRNYSAKGMAIKLYKEKKEAEEMDWKERKDD